MEQEHVFEFYKNDELVGCGMVIRTKAGWNFCDLGVWVHPQKRGHSLGAQILLLLREFALENQMKPSCGCAIENIASQKTIEKSGFVSKHKLICFTVD
ncbi:MAG: GNAT family N-acetyltransferase [Bacteroidales bacterium]|nr:GNAT family N-acetyltransferase [Bacteroidales bacterium]